ncbi:MAG: M23 family metallopeptidase [Acidimicrobiia bacterium]|nr:M23 family metallopeptidase [Acidimicrobiia bacterium]
MATPHDSPFVRGALVLLQPERIRPGSLLSFHVLNGGTVPVCYAELRPFWSISPSRNRLLSTIKTLLVLLVIGASFILPGSASAQVRGTCGAWSAVSGTIVKDFDPPVTRFGRGHRGIKVDVGAGAPIRATQAGVIRFVGSVAGTPWVSVQLGDGTISTFGGAVGVGFNPGDSVSPGDVVAQAQSAIIHVGLRSGEDYLDPIGLLGGVPGRVRLTRWGGDLGPPPELCRVLAQTSDALVAVVSRGFPAP